MASFGSALAQSLAERMNERRRFLAEQRAVADERLRGIESSRRATVDRARTALQASANALITSGFSEAEVSQIVETDPAEAIRLGTRVQNDRLRADDIRTAITFRDDYRPGTPLSEIIREATPIFQDIEEPEPAARQQNIFQRMFSMDVSQDMDRYYRQSNFGGFSGYDVLGSVEADPFRARQGEPIVDYGAIPTQMTETSRTRLTDSAKDSITGRAATIIDVLRREGGDENASIARRLDAIQDSPRAIIDFLFDDSEANAATYAALAPYREVLLEELIPVYQEGPSVFNTVSPRLSSILGEYVAARNEEGVPTEEAPEGITVTTLPPAADAVDLGEVTEDNAQEALNSILESEDETFLVNGVTLGKNSAIRFLQEGFDVERPIAGVETEGRSGLGTATQEFFSRADADAAVTSTLTGLATGRFGPGSAPLNRFIRWVREGDREVLDEADAIKRATDTLREKEDEVINIVLYDAEARQLLREDPLRFLEEYSEQLNGE